MQLHLSVFRRSEFLKNSFFKGLNFRERWRDSNTQSGPKKYWTTSKEFLSFRENLAFWNYNQLLSRPHNKCNDILVWQTLRVFYCERLLKLHIFFPWTNWPFFSYDGFISLIFVSTADRCISDDFVPKFLTFKGLGLIIMKKWPCCSIRNVNIYPKNIMQLQQMSAENVNFVNRLQKKILNFMKRSK